MTSCAGLNVERILVTNMDADAQVPSLYVQEVDRAAAAAEDPHLLVRSWPVVAHHSSWCAAGPCNTQSVQSCARGSQALRCSA